MVKKATRSKKRTSRAHTFHQGVLNTLAVCLAMLPILFIGVWFQGVANGAYPTQDPRKVSTHDFIQASPTPKLFDEPLVSVTFDDGWESAYTNGLPLLDKYKIRTTQYILPGEFSDHNYISVAQAHSYKDAGHEIGSHTVDHKELTTLSNADVLYELETSKAMLQKEKLVPYFGVNFASPNSATNASILENVSHFYSSHRNTLADISNGVTEVDVNVGPTLPKYDIIACSIRQNTTIEQIQQALAYAKQHNGWLVLVYHQIDDSQELFSVNAGTFEQQLQAIKQSNIKTVTVGEVMGSNPKVSQ